MEIEWGSFYFKAEGSVAILLAATPVVLIMTLPRIADAIKKTVYLITRNAKKKLTLLDRITKTEKEGGTP